MASVKDFYKKKLLAAKDISKGMVKGTITDVYQETPKGKDADGSTKLVIELDDGEHRIQLNKTNALSLAKLMGDDTDSWIGKKVKVSTQPTTFSGQATIGLKIEPQK